MKKNYYYNDFFARPYKNMYSYRKPYENFAEILVSPIIDVQESFFPLMDASTSSINEGEFKIYNKFNMNNNTDIYDGIEYEEERLFQKSLSINSLKIGPSITAMPTIIDFEEED